MTGALQKSCFTACFSEKENGCRLTSVHFVVSRAAASFCSRSRDHRVSSNILPDGRIVELWISKPRSKSINFIAEEGLK